MIGFTPAEVNEMSLWELNACCEGYRKAHSPDEPPAPPTPEAFAAGIEHHLKMTGQTKH